MAPKSGWSATSQPFWPGIEASPSLRIPSARERTVRVRLIRFAGRRAAPEFINRLNHSNTVKVTYLSLCIVVVGGALSAACSKGESAQAKGREAPARAVASEAVRQEQLRRSVEVVGTLAAVDQVTIASQAEGAVSKVLVDLGDHVKDGQPLIELDREKLEYNLQNQKAALARALAKYGANDPGHLPEIGRAHV